MCARPSSSSGGRVVAVIWIDHASDAVAAAITSQSSRRAAPAGPPNTRPRAGPARRDRTAPRPRATRSAGAARAAGPREVVGALRREADVRREERAPRRCRRRLARAHEVEQHGAPRDRRRRASAPRPGRIRRARRDVEVGERDGPSRAPPASSSPVIRKPERTKKTSTPTKPPQERQARVVEDDEQDGDRAKALQVLAMLHGLIVPLPAAAAKHIDSPRGRWLHRFAAESRQGYPHATPVRRRRRGARPPFRLGQAAAAARDARPDRPAQHAAREEPLRHRPRAARQARTSTTTRAT